LWATYFADQPSAELRQGLMQIASAQMMEYPLHTAHGGVVEQALLRAILAGTAVYLPKSAEQEHTKCRCKSE
jgi:hypothetical protein